jgi:hypothetical protein
MFNNHAQMCNIKYIHKILQSEQYIKSKDIQQDKHSG